jgi:hypothetical protein
MLTAPEMGSHMTPELQAESIGWLPLAQGAYLHVSDENATEMLVVGVPQAGAAVLLAG